MPRPWFKIRRGAVLALAIIACTGAVARGQNDGDLFSAAPQRRRPIVIGLPAPTGGQSGEIKLEPNVVVNGAAMIPAGGDYRNPQASQIGADGGVSFPLSLSSPLTSGGVIPTAGVALPLRVIPANQPLAPPAAAGTGAAGPSAMPLPALEAAPGEELPPGGVPPLEMTPKAEPLFAQSLCATPEIGPHVHHHKGTFYGLGGVEAGTGDPGIGHERVMFAPFAIDITQPESDLKFRFDAFYHRYNPDRVEYFWAREGQRGPKLAETFVNNQDVTTTWEVASGKAFSITTELPIRIVDPVNNVGTAGLGDLSITTKTVLLDGNEWQITQIFRTITPTGAANKGLGTGHVSLEPGMLFRYKWSPETYFHGELEYWFPLGGDPVYDGQVLKYGFGISHLLYENDTLAVIPTLEFVGYTVFNGAQTAVPPTGIPQPVDTMGIFNVHPGIRFVRDSLGDLGTYEWGVGAAFGITANKWYNAMLLVEARFLF